MTILDAFSWMIQGDKKLRPVIEEAYHVRPDLGFIGKVLKEKGIAGLSQIKPAIFTPILMMRAERLSNAEEILKKTNGECSVEPKYDGFRVQVHYKKEVRSQKSEVRLYSRSLEDVTYMYPDVVAAVQKQLIVEDVIFEGEAIGYNPQSGDFLPFQETVQRKRKYGIEDKAKEIPLILFAFDILYKNGETLLKTPFIKRRQVLQKAVKGGDDIFANGVIVARDEIVTDAKKIELIFDDAISRGLEGIVVKKLDGIYQAGARGFNWIKYKRSYSSKIDDTIDCLVMGYDVGKGKRTNFGIGAILVGVYDEEMDKFVTVAKIGTGLTDDEWREIEKRCQKLRGTVKPALYEVDAIMNADIWVKPGIVLEIKADEITRSPVHTAGRTLKETKTKKAYEVDTPGFALRFPRLQQFRDDKRPEETTSLKEVQELFSLQKH
jgi:DNA ligase-1